MSFYVLPDVLMGDIFVDALSAAPKFTVEDQEVLDFPEKFPENQESNHSENDAVLDKEQANFFLFTTPPVGGSGGSCAVICDACGLAFRKSSSFIRCAECPVYLCVTCFSSGAEFGLHKRGHAYTIISSRNNSNVFSKNLSGKLAKLSWTDVTDFFEKSKKLGFINFADLETKIGGLADTVTVATRSSRGLRSVSAEPKSEAAPIVVTDVEKVFVSLLNLLTKNYMQDQSWPELDPPVHGPSGGPANYNPQRAEFEHEYLPEAETILAAVQPPFDELTALFDAYSLLLDERERRRKVIVEANLLHLREFAATVHKKKDSREMFEKCKLFIRPCLKFPGFLDAFVALLTERKRCLDRLKRLHTLQQNGVYAEDASAIQFDIDRKKRNDLNARRQSIPGTKIWTFLPREVAPTDIESAVRSLPGGAQLDAQGLALCVELHIAPQHYLVVKLAIETVKNRADLGEIIHSGIFGTTRRYLLAAQGLPISATGGSSNLSLAEMKAKLIECCQSKY